MATNDKVTQPSIIDQQEGQNPHNNPNVYPEFSELDAEQAFRWLLQFFIDALCLVGAILIRSAMDTGRPELAKQIKHEFHELLKSRLPDTLRQVSDEFRQLWPQLQPILCEIKGHGLKAIDLHWSTISEVLNSMRECGYISSQVCNEEILTDVLQGERIVRQVPPGHPLLHLLGFENEGEWNKLTLAQQQVMLSRVLTEEAKHPFLRIATKLIHRWAEDSSTSSVSQERVAHDDEALERIEAKSGEPQEKLLPDEVIELLRKQGINKNDLTDKEWRFIFNLYDAFWEGAEIGSKKGLSLNAYFGGDTTSRKRLSRLQRTVINLKTKKS